MIRPKEHISIKPIQVKNLTFYKKALGLYELSRKLYENNTHTLYDQQEAQSYADTLVEDMMILSIRLPYTIALAQTTPHYQNRMSALQGLSESITRLKNRCKELDTLATEQHVQIHRLRRELHSFSNLFKSWRLILTRQN